MRMFEWINENNIIVGTLIVRAVCAWKFALKIEWNRTVFGVSQPARARALSFVATLCCLHYLINSIRAQTREAQTTRENRNKDEECIKTKLGKLLTEQVNYGVSRQELSGLHHKANKKEKVFFIFSLKVLLYGLFLKVIYDVCVMEQMVAARFVRPEVLKITSECGARPSRKTSFRWCLRITQRLRKLKFSAFTPRLTGDDCNSTESLFFVCFYLQALLLSGI